jgi:hypothetical protein
MKHVLISTDDSTCTVQFNNVIFQPYSVDTLDDKQANTTQAKH